MNYKIKIITAFVVIAAAFYGVACHPKNQQPVSLINDDKNFENHPQKCQPGLFFWILLKLTFCKASISVMAPVAQGRLLLWEIKQLRLSGMTASMKLLTSQIKQRSEIQRDQ